MSKNVFWIAGESSGDLHASMVLKVLNEKYPELKHSGIGGSRMQAEGFDPLFPFKRFGVMGFWEVVKHLKFFLDVEKQILKLFQRAKPDLIVLVDYPGFNLRMAKTAYNLDIPVLFFISPQFWAWKHGRVDKLREYTNFVASILPFEKELLEIHRVTSDYVGHPIAEEINFEVDKETFAKTFRLETDKEWLGFIPGSRDAEVKKILPEMIKAIRKFPDDKYCFLISKARSVDGELFDSLIPTDLQNRIFIIDGYTYEMMKYCRFLAVTSGTATLETAFIGTPHLIVYKTSLPSYQIGKHLVKIERIGLPNIILEDDVIPELIQDKVNAEEIYTVINRFLSDETEYERVAEELKRVKSLLSEKSASNEVAEIINRMLNES